MKWTRLALIAVFAGAAWGCPGQDESFSLEFVQPRADLLEVTDDDPVPLAVEIVSPNPVVEMQLFVDGRAELMRPPLRTGDCQLGCVVQWLWPTDGFAEGDHELAVEAIDQTGDSARASVPLRIAIPPRIRIVSPERGLAAGVGALAASVEVFDRSPVTVDVFVDGEPVDASVTTAGGCTDGCAVDTAIDTRDFDDGEYTVEFVATDRIGESARSAVTVGFADIVYVSVIHVNNPEFEVGPLEFEVHLFDEGQADLRLGCSGKDSGLGPVQAGMTYELVGSFQRAGDPDALLTPHDLVDRDLKLLVLEADRPVGAECPGAPSFGFPGFDDRVGAVSFPASSLPGEPIEDVEDIVYLQLDVGRPL